MPTSKTMDKITYIFSTLHLALIGLIGIYHLALERMYIDAVFLEV